MSAAYDTYDYPSYWKGREYEHKSEIIAFKSFIEKIKYLKVIVDMGAGYGRLTPHYLFRSEKTILVDPSEKLLRLARNKINTKKVIYIKSSIERVFPKIRRNCADLVIFVRVLHHIKNIDKALTIINKICKRGGYLILEFPNKTHLKATILELLKGNITYPLDFFPIDLSSKRSIKENKLPFINFHPDFIKEKLKNHRFKIIETRSVSNIRSTFLKKYIPLEILLFFERYLQILLSKIVFGPSIFILAKRTD